MEFLGKGMELFKVELSKVDFMSIDWTFHPVGWGQNPIVRVVRAFCGVEPDRSP